VIASGFVYILTNKNSCVTICLCGYLVLMCYIKFHFNFILFFKSFVFISIRQMIGCKTITEVGLNSTGWTLNSVQSVTLFIVHTISQLDNNEAIADCIASKFVFNFNHNLLACLEYVSFCVLKHYKGDGVISGVQVAARSLIQLFREKNPHLLHHKYRVMIVACLCSVVEAI